MTPAQLFTDEVMFLKSKGWICLFRFVCISCYGWQVKSYQQFYLFKTENMKSILTQTHKAYQWLLMLPQLDFIYSLFIYWTTLKTWKIRHHQLIIQTNSWWVSLHHLMMEILHRYHLFISKLHLCMQMTTAFKYSHSSYYRC